jgi:hypothetical protein
MNINKLRSESDPPDEQSALSGPQLKTPRAEMQDIVSDSRPRDYVVCGYFTDDYRPFADHLVS